MAEITDEVKEQMLEEAYSVTPNFSTDYNDKRLTDINDAESDALTENKSLYDGIIDRTDKYYQDQIDTTQAWADKQSQLQQEQTDFAIEKIEQQKEQARKDYLKEQSASYVDWQKQSNKYGTEAEKIASAGLTSTGFSESSQVSMYNTYQLRVAMARESLTKANLEYDNAIKDAFLQNNAKLAEIAYTALQKKLELSLQGFQYKNNLVLEQANKELEIKNMYWNRYLGVLDQINHENDVKRDVWKYQDTQKWNTEQAELDRQATAEENRIRREFEEKENQLDREFEERQNQLDREHDFALETAKTAAEKEKADYAHKLAMEKLAQEQKNAKELLAYEQSLAKQSVKITGGSGGSSGSRGISHDERTWSNNVVGNGRVSTEYYNGTLNPDANRYGTTANGYQPKGISGHGKLTKTNQTIDNYTVVVYGANKGQQRVVTQAVWKAEDGTKWYWEGRENKYKQI